MFKCVLAQTSTLGNCGGDRGGIARIPGGIKEKKEVAVAQLKLKSLMMMLLEGFLVRVPFKPGREGIAQSQRIFLQKCKLREEGLAWLGAGGLCRVLGFEKEPSHLPRCHCGSPHNPGAQDEDKTLRCL